MAKSDSTIIYLVIAAGAAYVLLTDNPLKTAIMSMIPAAGATTDTTTPAKTTTKKHHKGHHNRNRHSNFAYQDCGF